jgi:hypothetical protein
MVRLEGLGKLKNIQWPQRDWNPRSSGLLHSVSTIYTAYHAEKHTYDSKVTRSIFINKYFDIFNLFLFYLKMLSVVRMLEW